MAGNYPDVPGPRMAYDRDGSVGFRCSGNKTGVVTEVVSANLLILNSESGAGVSIGPGGFGGTVSFGIIFPELRDLAGIIVQMPSGLSELETSPDSTSGLDGTWTTELASTGGTTTPPTYRDDITALDADGVKAIRITHTYGGDSACYGLHLFGKVAAGETPDRLRLWHPTLDQALDDQDVSPDGAYFDWGDVPQNTMLDREFRIKNNSTTDTADDVDISTESPTPLAVPDVLTLSKDGVSFSSTISFTSIAPEEITDICILRRNTPANATLSVAVMRIIAVAGGWS